MTRRRIGIVAMVVAVCSPTLAVAQFPVGYAVLAVRDSSRAWEMAIDPAGVGPRRAPVPRPIRISVWYPASESSGTPMQMSDYLIHPPLGDPLVDALSGRLDARDRLTFIRQVLGGEVEGYGAAATTPMSAVRNAPPVSNRRFPLVLYSAGLNSFDSDNARLMTTLASRGFVVATVAQVGRTADRLDLTLSAADIETQVRDLEVAAQAMRRRPDVAPAPTGVIGWSMGGVAALLYQMRHPEVAALVTLDPSFGFRNHPSRVNAAPTFALEQTTVPLLVLMQASADATDRIIDTLIHSTRVVIQIPGVIHEDFAIGGSLTAQLGTRQGRRSAPYAATVAERVVAHTVAFLDTHLLSTGAETPELRAAVAAWSTLVPPAGRVAVNLLPGSVPPIGATQLALLVERSGYDSAATIVRERMRLIHAQPALREAEVNVLAYGSLSGAPQLAVALFRLNAIAFPKSANAFDSLADGYLGIGDRAHAGTAYRMVLALLPGDTTISDETREILRGNATSFLATSIP